MTQSIFQAQPFELPFDPRTTALVMIDMQRDFVEAGGFGEALGNDVSRVRTAIAPCTEVLAAARQKGIMVIHTREGHRADLSDCPPAKLTRGGKTFIGERDRWDAFWSEVKQVMTSFLNCTRWQANR